MALALKNISVELREISLKNRPDALLNISPKGTVPVLYINQNTILEESMDIIKWTLVNESVLYIKARDKQNTMIDRNDNDFKYWLDRYKYYDKYPDKDKEHYRNMFSDIVMGYNEILEQQKYLVSNDIQIADIALFPFIRQFANVDKIWFEKTFDNIAIWLDRIMQSKLYISVMDKYPLWDELSPKIITNFKTNE